MLLPLRASVTLGSNSSSWICEIQNLDCCQLNTLVALMRYLQLLLIAAAAKFATLLHIRPP